MIVKARSSFLQSASVIKMPVLLMIFVLLSIASSFADTIDAHQAATAVNTWLATDEMPLGANLPRQIKDVQTYNDENGNPEYYIVNLEPSGFVIVSAEDLTEPIVGFVSGGTYDTSPESPMAALVNADLHGRISEARENIKSAKSKGKQFVPSGKFLEAKNKWKKLFSAELTASATSSLYSMSDVRVAPLVKSKWNQQNVGSKAVYNYYTPMGPNGSVNNYPCGCVATAIAQLMRYFQYPTDGVGSWSFNYSIDGQVQGQKKALIGGDGNGGPYNWSDMPLVPDYTITPAQCQAIGALCSDAGLATSVRYSYSGYYVNYGSGGTGAIVSSYELKDVFHYSNAITGYNNGNNIGAGLNAMINPNLDAGYPVVLGILSGSGGHAIVADGYGYDTSTLYHHLNLGWGGYSDAWYNLPNVSAGGYTFNAVDTCIYNVYTTGTGEIISGRVTDSNGLPLSGVSVSAVSGSTAGSATTNSNGVYAITRIPSSKKYTVSAQYAGYTFTSQTVTTGRSTDNYSTSGNVWGVNFTGDGGPLVTSFAISGGSVSSSSLNVTLDNICAGSPAQYMASESSSFVGASWNTYSTSPSFTLSSGGGVKTVYFKIRNSSGVESPVVSDTISVDSTLPVSSVSPVSKIFRTGFSAVLSASKPAVIYYTTDGSIPTVSSKVYSTPVPISSDTILRFFAVDNVGNVESTINRADYYFLADDGSIADAKKLANGASVRLGGKVLYYLQSGFGYIEEPGRFSGIRVQGMLPSSAGYVVCLAGNIVKQINSEPYIQVLMMNTESSGSVRPLAANNLALANTLIDGLYVTAWGLVQPGSVTANSYVISDGSPGSGIKVITPGIPSVFAGEFTTVTGAAGLVNGARVIYSD